MCHYCDYEVPAPTDLPGVRLRRHPLQRPGHAAARGGGPGPLSQRAWPADGHRHHAGPRQPRAGARAFRSGKVRILLGTQMIAKGLDFPNVTLVGVINADTALHLPDFRAAERTFQLVTQVAGRTGRGPKGGRVLVQTFSPDHPAIRAAARHDYAAFAAGELPIRQMLRYPPFAEHDPAGGPRPRRSRSRPSSPTTSPSGCAALAQPRADWQHLPGPAQEHRDEQLKAPSRVRVLGPAPCPFARLRGDTASRSRSRPRRRAAPGRRAPRPPPSWSRRTDVQWIVDVDPVDML